MTRRSPWLDPTTRQAAIVFAIVFALANAVWIFLDHSIPSWDQSHYLSTTLQYQHAFDSGGPIDLLRSIHGADPGHGPLFTVLLLPMVYIFGPMGRSGLLLNLLLAPVLYFSAGEIAWIIFRSWSARLVTILLVATMPLMVGLMHDVLVDFLLVTLAAVSLLLLLKTEGFQRRWMSLALGLTMGLGTLTKVTFPAYMLGPLAVVFVQIFLARRSNAEKDLFARRPNGRRLAWNLAGAVFAYLLVVAPWYGTNFPETLAYVRSTTSGPLSLGAGPSDPYTFHAITSFTLSMISFNVSWIIALIGLIAVAINYKAVLTLFRRPLRWGPILRIAFILTWILIPYLLVALAHNQDVRLMAAAMPGMAVLVAGAVTVVRWPRIRLALVGVAALLLVYITLDHVTTVTPGFMPKRIEVTVGSYGADLQLDSSPIGLYEQLPGPDYGTPIIEYIEQVAQREPGGTTAPRTICLLQSEAVANSNTFGYLASARGDPYVFIDVLGGPTREDREGLKAVLKGCGFALYVEQPQPSEEDQASRLALVNAPYAANYMTPETLSLFNGPRRTFDVGSNGKLEDEPGYLSTAGRKGQVQVLVRTPAD